MLVIPGSLVPFTPKLGSAWNHQFTVERASTLHQTLQTPANIMESSPHHCTASVGSDCVSGNLTVITAWESVCHRTLGQRSWILQQDCLSPQPQNVTDTTNEKSCFNFAYIYTHAHTHTEVGSGWGWGEPSKSTDSMHLNPAGLSTISLSILPSTWLWSLC